jgi:hypothetical protein
MSILILFVLMGVGDRAVIYQGGSRRSSSCWMVPKILICIPCVIQKKID